ncbi:MAG: OsmC family protein [Coprobacillaceae bacterium]
METLNVKLQSLDDKAMFSVNARNNPPIIVDYFPPVGTEKGYTSLELLMASFGSCISTTLVTILRYKMQKTVTGINTDVEGLVRDTHPKCLNQINVNLDINSVDTTKEEVQHALKLAEKDICPVWAMIKGNVNIEITFTIQ